MGRLDSVMRKPSSSPLYLANETLANHRAARRGGAYLHQWYSGVVNWDDLKIFLAVAANGSVRGAAAELGVSHSTVSRRIEAFERGLGVRVLERLPTGWVPTAEGEELLEAGAGIAEAVAQAERRLLGRDEQESGEIRVSAPDLIANYLLIPALPRFFAQFPDITVDLQISFELANLTQREADVALRITESPPEYLVGREIGRYTTATYVSRSYLHDHDLDDHSDLSWIGWNDRTPYPQWVRDSVFADVPAKGRYPDSQAQLAATRAGMGLAMLPCFMADPDPELVRVAPPIDKYRHSVWVLTHADMRKTARIRSFMRFVAGAFAKQKAALDGCAE
jgi:DNA-binding transcriptional LysR family regulator